MGSYFSRPETKPTHSDKPFKNKNKNFQKFKHKNVKPTIKNWSSVCYKDSQTSEKNHKTVSLCDKKSQTCEKSPKNENLCDKKSQTSEKMSQNCKFMW